MTLSRRILAAAIAASVFAAVPVVTAVAQPAGPQPEPDQTGAVFAATAPARVLPLNGSAVSVQGVAAPGGVELAATPRATVRVIRVTTVGDWLRSLDPGPAGAQDAAAQAQAVAWRSYALRRVEDGGGRTTTGVADVCSHVDCPLGTRVSTVVPAAADTDAGTDVGTDAGGSSTGDATGADDVSDDAANDTPATPAAASWTRAVDATRDEILRSGTKPALARSHALAGGATRTNESVFTDGGFPYLTAVDVAEDEAATGETAQWSAQLPLVEVERTLRAAGLQVPPKLSEVRSTGRADDPQIALIGDGAEVRVSKTDFADALDAVLPDDTAPSEGRRSPLLDRTVPSYRFTVTTSGDDVTIEGTGDGHGVGMSATAAAAQASDGADVDAILARFYPGTSTVDLPDADATQLRVEVAEVPVATLDSTKGFRVSDVDGATVVESALLEWSVRVATPPTAVDGGVLEFTGPAGTDVELRIEEFSTPLQGTAGTGVPVAFVLSRPAFVTATLTDGDGAETTQRLRDGAVLPAGRSSVVVPIETPGTWKIRLVADDRSTTARTETQSLAVEERRRGPSPVGALALAALLTGLVMATLAGRAANKRRRAAGT